MHMNRLYHIDPLRDPRWERFLHGNPRSSVFHTTGWLQALYDTYRYEPVAYTSSSPDEELENGVVFCRVKSWLTGHRLVSLPFSDHCEPLVKNNDEFLALLQVARGELEKGTWRYIELRPLSAEYSGGIEKYPESYVIHFLDLRPSLEELYKKLHGDSIRRKIQKGEREHLTLEAGSSESLLAEFYQLHVTTRQRQHLPPHPLSWFHHVLKCLGKDATIRVARKDGRAIASILTLSNKQKLVYKYGCSDAEFHNLGSMPFLFWDMIRDAKQRGFLEIDLGRSEVENTGLITFKDRWGANRQSLVYVRYPPPKTKPGQRSTIMKLGKQVLAHCPGRLLQVAGNLLYPHVG